MGTMLTYSQKANTVSMYMCLMHILSRTITSVGSNPCVHPYDDASLCTICILYIQWLVSICFHNWKFKGMSSLPYLNSAFKMTVFLMYIFTTLITTLEYMESHLYFELL